MKILHLCRYLHTYLHTYIFVWYVLSDFWVCFSQCPDLIIEACLDACIGSWCFYGQHNIHLQHTACTVVACFIWARQKLLPAWNCRGGVDSLGSQNIFLLPVTVVQCAVRMIRSCDMWFVWKQNYLIMKMWHSIQEWLAHKNLTWNFRIDQKPTY